MSDAKFMDTVVGVTAFIDEQGYLQPQQLVLQERPMTIVSVGRQWQSAGGRHVLIETSDGSRFELLLSRAELVWRIKRFWPLEMAA